MKIRSLIAIAAAGALAGSAASAPTTGPLAPLFAPALGDTRAAILVVDGRIAAKRYAPGYSDANRFISWSAAKTMTAMLIGELVSDGRLSLDAPAPIAEWRGRGDPRGAITLRHLLQMASGLEHTEVGEPVERSDTNQVLFVGGTGDMAARSIAQPLEAKPGAKFEYSSLTTIILSEIITRSLTPSRDPRVRAKAYRDFAAARLFGPAGVTTAVLEFDGAGTQIGGSLIHMSLDDFAKMGALLLHGRGADGAQVIAPDWLAFMKTPSATEPTYGGQTWLDRFKQDGGPGTVSMQGHLGQYVLTFHGTGEDGRKHGYVMVRLGNTHQDRLGSVRAAMGGIAARLAR